MIYLFQSQLNRFGTHRSNTHRNYHVYKFASQTLSILEHDLTYRKKIMHDIMDKQATSKKTQTSTLFKDIRRNRPLQDVTHTQEVLEAAKNIKRLCNEAYEACLEFESTGNKPVMDDELISFLEATNEMFPCMKKELYHKMVKTN